MMKALFNEHCYEAIANLTLEQKGMLLDSIFEYVLYGNVKDCEPIVSMAFGFIRAEIDSRNEKARILSQKRSEAGRKGGRPRLETANDEESKKKQKKQLLSKESPSPLPPSPPLEESLFPEPLIKEDNPPIIPLTFSQEKTNEDANASSLSTGVDAVVEAEVVIDFKSLVEFFNATLKRSNSLISQIKDIKGTRMTMVKARVKEYGKDGLTTVIKKAAVSSFLNGCGNTGFVATFDWLVRPNNFIKVLEGNYDNRQTTPNQTNGTNWQPNSGQQQRAADAAAIVDRLLKENRPVD